MIDGRFSHGASMMVDPVRPRFSGRLCLHWAQAVAAADQPIVSWAIRSSMMDRLPSSRSQASPTVS